MTGEYERKRAELIDLLTAAFKGNALYADAVFNDTQQLPEHVRIALAKYLLPADYQIVQLVKQAAGYRTQYKTLYRSAVTGRFVSRAEAEANPHETEREQRGNK